MVHRVHTSFDEVDALISRHTDTVVRVHIAIYIGRTRPSDGKVLLHESSPERNFEDLSSVVWVPSSADQSSHQSVLVVVANLLHECGAGSDLWETT